jgi:hypothetical protein
MSKNHQSIICTIDRIEGQKAVLTFDFNKNDQNNLIVPLGYLPKNVAEGSVLVVEFIEEKQMELRRKNLAKQILMEILKGE